MKILFRIVVSVLLIALVLYLADIFSPQGRAQFLAMLASASIPLLILSFVIGLIIHLASSLKWYMLLPTHNMQSGFFRVFAYYMVGQFYNLLLPTSVGGDVVRGYELGRFTGQKMNAMASVFVERFTGFIVLVALSALAIFLNLKIFNLPVITVSLVVFASGLALLGWLVLDKRPFEFAEGFFTKHFPVSEKLFAKIGQMQTAIDSYKRDKPALVWAFINSFIFYFLAIINIYITARVFSLDVPFQYMVIATPVIMLIMNIPISIGNYGLLEFAYTFTFELLGLGAALGLSTALLMRLKTFFDGGLGGIFHPLYSTYKHSAHNRDQVAN